MAILKATFCLLLLAIATTYATSARILDESSSPVAAPVAAPASDPAESPAADVVPDSSNPVVAPVADATSPPAVAPITGPQTVVNGATPASATVVAPVADATSPPVVAPITAPQTIVNGATPASPTAVAPVSDATSPPAVAPTTASQTIVNGATPASATVGNSDAHHPLSFFMHDVLGGTNPSAKAVTGVVTNSAVNGQIPFAKPNGAIIPANNGVPITNSNSGTINNNNLPFLAGLGGPTLLQNNGNGNGRNGNGLPFLTTGQLPSGTSIQQLLFGTMTVIDDELTEGHELGSAVVGKAQGFYVASSEDGTSQTMAFTVMFESGHYMDTISFFGVHRTQSSESYLGVMGGTGKYVNAKGFANVKTIHPTGDQHATDGAETLLEFTVYLS